MTCVFVGSSAFSMTLQEAIKFSLQNNPKTVANQLRVEAMEERVKAQRMSWYPKLNISTGIDTSNFKQTSSDGASSASQSRGNRMGVSSSINLYDGGAEKYSQLAAEANLKATRARYNSSNALIPNTRGSIARQVSTAYVSLLEIKEQKKYLDQLAGILKLMMSVADENEKVLLSQRMDDLKTSLLSNSSKMTEALIDFKYFATVPAPAEMQTLEQVIDSLKIPVNADEAFRIAVQKSPNLKQAEFELEAAKQNYKSEKANLYSPRVSLATSINRSGSQSDGSSSNSRSVSIGVMLSYTLDPATGHRDSAASKNVEAAQRDSDGATEELKFEIESIYPRLDSMQQIYRSQLESLNNAEVNLANLVKKLQGGEKIDLQKFGLPILDNQRQQTFICLSQKIEILTTRFSIQRTVGTLFDNVGLELTAF